MSVFKSRPAFILLLAGLASACATVKTDFKEAETHSPALYGNILLDTCGQGSGKHASPDAITRVTVYKTAFRETYIEAGSVLSPASLNESGRRKGVTYKSLLGNSQDLYLIHVKAHCNQDVWVYFSVWYRASTDMPVQEQYGFGRAYLGIQDDADKTIHFTNELKMERGPEAYYLAYKTGAQFFFVLDNLERGEEPIRVNRIVTEEDNKFGGPNAFVFKVADHFPGEMRTLDFRKLSYLFILIIFSSPCHA